MEKQKDKKFRIWKFKNPQTCQISSFGREYFFIPFLLTEAVYLFIFLSQKFKIQLFFLNSKKAASPPRPPLFKFLCSIRVRPQIT